MKIAIQHHTALPIHGYGGTERIVFWHMKELARLGHTVYFIGPSSSDVEKYGIIHIKEDSNQAENWIELIPKDTDIIHLNYNFKVPINIPTINTVHGNGKPGEVFTDNSVFVSKAHAKLHNATAYIYNALDFDEYPITEEILNKKLQWDHFLFLAKASWKVKNLKHCVEACRKNHKHLHVAGGRWWGLSRYIHSHGIIGGEKKLELLKNADCLLFPVRWPEPFGIAVIEAMAYGLPVIGSKYGSLPELIKPEVGFIAENKEQLISLVGENKKQFNRAEIRSYAEKTFAIDQYSKKYLELYEKVIKGETLNSKPPTLTLKEKAENLLPF